MNKRNITNIKKVLIVVGIVLILILGVLWIIQFVQTDNCLEKGGRWNSSLKECECPHTIDLSRIADYYWKCEYDTTINSEYLNRGALLDSISKSPNSLIDILNRQFQKTPCFLIFHLKLLANSLIFFLNLREFVLFFLFAPKTVFSSITFHEKAHQFQSIIVFLERLFLS